MRGAAAVLLLALACKKEEAGPPYTLATARDGEQLKVEVKTGAGYHVNDDYPVSFDAEGAGRLQLKDAVKKTPCASEPGHSCSATVYVPNTDGTLAFSVCSAEQCLREKVAIAAVR